MILILKKCQKEKIINILLLIFHLQNLILYQTYLIQLVKPLDIQRKN